MILWYRYINTWHSRNMLADVCKNWKSDYWADPCGFRIWAATRAWMKQNTDHYGGKLLCNRTIYLTAWSKQLGVTEQWTNLWFITEALPCVHLKLTAPGLIYRLSINTNCLEICYVCWKKHGAVGGKVMPPLVALSSGIWGQTRVV